MSTLVSAVITTYKRAAGMVMRAVRSVLQQTYGDIEVIVVDDSPSGWHDSKSVEEAITQLGDCRVRYYKNPENMGACAARNTGVSMSNGDYVAFLDDDDEWKPTKIEKQMRLADRYDLVYCMATTIYADGTKEKFSNVYANGNLYERLLYRNIVGSTSLALVSKKAFEDVGGFDPEMQSSQDYDLWLRISKKYMIGCVNESLVIYHAHDGDRITSNPDKKIQGFTRIIDKNLEYYKKNKRALSKQLSNMVYFYVAKGDKKSAKKTAFQSFRLCPWLFNEHLHSVYRIIRGRG